MSSYGKSPTSAMPASSAMVAIGRISRTEHHIGIQAQVQVALDTVHPLLYAPYTRSKRRDGKQNSSDRCPSKSSLSTQVCCGEEMNMSSDHASPSLHLPENDPPPSPPSSSSADANETDNTPLHPSSRGRTCDLHDSYAHRTRNIQSISPRERDRQGDSAPLAQCSCSPRSSRVKEQSLTMPGTLLHSSINEDEVFNPPYHNRLLLHDHTFPSHSPCPTFLLNLR
ncbi:hypothetical protein JVT61DRAFT_14408 [Boletus reticuloceps]|uniref:Uncharacterized protein n=1 Tax=Boletus reticuloceps TaxID=495285 RepID=A0A8I2YQY8_9AGAM|nr:hypothetical protein JVT61DRAFT_14408 [Boletus reticuloceps]